MSDNFEIHDRATELSDTMTPYALARRVVELEAMKSKIRAETVCESAGKTKADEFEKVCKHIDSVTSSNKLEMGEL